MKAVTLNELKKELSNLGPSKLLELCLRLAKHKKENKELLTYLLFEASNEIQFILNQKAYIDEQFKGLNKKTIYLAKKGLRRILRDINKTIRFSGDKRTEIELIIHFCFKLKNSNISIKESKVISNLYYHQVNRIKKTLLLLHEDLREDYLEEIRDLEI